MIIDASLFNVHVSNVWIFIKKQITIIYQYTYNPYSTNLSITSVFPHKDHNKSFVLLSLVSCPHRIY